MKKTFLKSHKKLGCFYRCRKSDENDCYANSETLLFSDFSGWGKHEDCATAD